MDKRPWYFVVMLFATLVMFAVIGVITNFRIDLVNSSISMILGIFAGLFITSPTQK